MRKIAKVIEENSIDFVIVNSFQLVGTCLTSKSIITSSGNVVELKSL